jgi:hypothetical protein
MPGEGDNGQGYRSAEEVRPLRIAMMGNMGLTGTGRIRMRSRRMRCIRWRICDDLVALMLDTGEDVDGREYHVVPRFTSIQFCPPL